MFWFPEAKETGLRAMNLMFSSSPVSAWVIYPPWSQGPGKPSLRDIKLYFLFVFLPLKSFNDSSNPWVDRQSYRSLWKLCVSLTNHDWQGKYSPLSLFPHMSGIKCAIIWTGLCRESYTQHSQHINVLFPLSAFVYSLISRKVTISPPPS